MRSSLTRSFAAVAVLGMTFAAAGLNGQAPVPPVMAFESIVHQPAQESSFTLDRSMLAAADGFFGGTDPEGRRIAAGLNSVTVHNFHYRDFASYDQGAFSALSAGYEAAGYRHLVNANQRGDAKMTDLWLRFQGANVTNVIVLTRADRNMNAISVDCTLRPLDLLHLGGHFGIPKVDENAVMVPADPNGASQATVPQQRAPQGPPPELKRHSADDPQ